MQLKTRLRGPQCVDVIARWLASVETSIVGFALSRLLF